MKKLFLFPIRSTTNPYINNFYNALSPFFDMAQKGKRAQNNARFKLLINSFSSDIYCLNWIESIAGSLSGFILFLVSFLALFFIKIGNNKIIWMFHNIHPHTGENIYSKIIQRFLFNYADLIVTHSCQAAEYAKMHAKNKVLYYCHPFSPLNINIKDFDGNTESVDIFIWGNILPYKGIPEFIEKMEKYPLNKSIKILGFCRDQALDQRIRTIVERNPNIKYENRRAEFSEIAVMIKRSKYVLFPYSGGSVSSSGALIDTIQLGGIPVGPNMGAFRDLNSEGLCLVYNDYDELFRILNSEIKLDEFRRVSFINNNTWEDFAKQISNIIYKELYC